MLITTRRLFKVSNDALLTFGFDPVLLGRDPALKVAVAVSDNVLSLDNAVVATCSFAALYDVVQLEVCVKVIFQYGVADKTHAAKGALKLDPFKKLCLGKRGRPKNWLRKRVNLLDERARIVEGGSHGLFLRIGLV